MRQELDKIWIELKVNIMSYIEQSRSINVCADIWITRGMTASFLGLTAHFFSLAKITSTMSLWLSELSLHLTQQRILPNL